MNYTKTTGKIPSSNRADKIAYYVYKPNCTPKALVQITHGMCEYAERYEDFIDCLCKEGYAVIIHDHIGHGNSVSSESDLGYFAVSKGWIYLINDLHRVSETGRKIFGGLPHYIIGHSMGSLVLRCYLAKFSSEIDGAVIMGTVGNLSGLMPFAKAMADSEITFHGVKSRSKKLNNIMFGMANMRIKNPRSKFDWISRDEKVVEKYEADSKCNFVFTASAFRDLFTLLEYCSDPSWYGKIRRDLPIILMSGSEDFVGQYGRGPMHIFTKLVSRGVSDTEIKLYDGCRHELLNELSRSEVYSDIVHWLSVRADRKALGCGDKS